MASFFRMGRQPDTFVLTVGFEGYGAANGMNAPTLETYEAKVEWDGEEPTQDVLQRLLDAERSLPFDTRGQTVHVTLDIDENSVSTGFGSGTNSPSTAQPQNHKRTDSGSIL